MRRGRAVSSAAGAAAAARAAHARGWGNSRRPLSSGFRLGPPRWSLAALDLHHVEGAEVISDEELARLSRLALIEIEEGKERETIKRDVAVLLRCARKGKEFAVKEGRVDEEKLYFSTDADGKEVAVPSFPDDLAEGGDMEAVLAAAKHRHGAFFSVPKVNTRDA